MNKLQYFSFLICLATLTSVHSQEIDRPIAIFTDAPTSIAQQVYIEDIVDGLRSAGFTISDYEVSQQVPRGELRTAVVESEAALGFSLLQDHVGEDDPAAALLSSPGSFISLAENRVAQRGAVGDLARDEVTEEGVVALRLWSHSTSALVSRVELASIDDFTGIKTITGDPYSIDFVEALGAAEPVQMAFAERVTAIQSGFADTTVLPQQSIDVSLLESFEGGSYVSEYKVGVGVTFASALWWKSLTAPMQQAVLQVLNQAENSSGSMLQSQIERTHGLSKELGFQAVFWDSLARDKVQQAVSAAVSARVGEEEALSILKFRDDAIAFDSEKSPESIEQDKLEPEGALETDTRIFFATDRRYDVAVEPLSSKFANTLDPKEVVRCGELAPSLHGSIGEALETPALAEATHLLRMDDCTARITNALKGTSDRLVVYVHGFRNSFDSAVRTGLAFARDAQIEGAVLIWSWPSGADLGSYDYDSESVLWSQAHFTGFVEKLLADEDVAGVDFIGHSMGTRLLAGLMQDTEFNNPSALVLAAADISRPLLRQAVSQAPAVDVTILATENDRALFLSNRKHKRIRVGRAKPLFLMENVDTIDLSAFDNIFSINHRHAFDTPEVITDLTTLFDGTWSAKARGLRSERQQGASLNHFVIYPDM